METSEEDLQVTAWLEAEQDGEMEAADRHFRSVIGRLPRLEPSPGFALRVLAHARMLPSQSASGVWVSWWLRIVVGTAMACTAVAVASLSMSDIVTAGVGVVRSVAIGIEHVWDWTGSSATAGFRVWTLAAQVGGALSTVCAQPGSAVFLATNLAAAAGALAALRRLLAPQEG
jgi:hypothetical protein